MSVCPCVSNACLSNLVKVARLPFPEYFVLGECMGATKDIMERIFLLKRSKAGGAQRNVKTSHKSDHLWSW